MKHPYRDLARSLRKNMTEAEQFMWQRLRYRQLAGHRFQRQAPIGDAIADFLCRAKRLIIELDGSQHVERSELDAERTRRLEAFGYRVLRFWNHEVLTDWETIEAVIFEALGGPAPHPNP